MIVTGLHYRTPFPVQPMKAIAAVATTQAAQSIVLTPAAVWSAGLLTGAVWLILGLTGLARTLSRIVPRAAVQGIVLGLGLSFMLNGVEMIASGWLVGTIALGLTLVLVDNRRFPAMIVLLVFGAAAALVQEPALLDELAALEFGLQRPEFALGAISWSDVLAGAVFLALPQLPLTLGNAVIAITEENNRLFPDRRVSEKRVAVSTGVMNLAAPFVGGVPMCHGAGGMAGHVRFGARTGGALLILGAILVLLALFASGSVRTLFRMFPDPVLGVILLMAGLQLATGAWDRALEKEQRFVQVLVAGFTVWNVGIAFVVGLAVDQLLRRGWVKP
jgi:MFS superfamily sulfate permease-like transporter